MRSRKESSSLLKREGVTSSMRENRAYSEQWKKERKSSPWASSHDIKKRDMTQPSRALKKKEEKKCRPLSLIEAGRKGPALPPSQAAERGSPTASPRIYEKEEEEVCRPAEHPRTERGREEVACRLL